MGSATLSRTRTLPGPGAVAVAASLLGVAAAGWALSADRMSGMDAGPGSSLGGLGWFLASWVPMMAAMMLPALVPAAVAIARTRPAAPFAIGYLIPWTVAGALAYALVEGVRSLELGFLAWDSSGRFVAGAAIAGAGLYQLTPLKAGFLRGCRARPAGGGPLRAGAAFGGICIGCCWALMAALFALGVMSLAWMALVAALIAAERLLAWPAPARRGVAVALLVLGLAVALVPQHVPGLTVPGSSPAMESMGAEMP
jgi:predicted metal-binding membrane protein